MKTTTIPALSLKEGNTIVIHGEAREVVDIEHDTFGMGTSRVMLKDSPAIHIFGRDAQVEVVVTEDEF